ncbi:unnamed protein product [Rhizoctonia solani]|uniref:Uncharacterized protein n=1 Tax=Rhizoctonia solani TaxID=456999 RepID=A0A8H3C5Q8_9AGAM|nr:unnamed protein product [Rhizoctonia solani]
MHLTDGLPYLPEFPIGTNSTNNTITVPMLGDLPTPFDILSILTFSQTSFTLLSSLYIAWQSLTQKIKVNMAIFADADRARNGVEELQKKMDKVLELLVSKSS